MTPFSQNHPPEGQNLPTRRHTDPSEGAEDSLPPKESHSQQSRRDCWLYRSKIWTATEGGSARNHHEVMVSGSYRTERP